MAHFRMKIIYITQNTLCVCVYSLFYIFVHLISQQEGRYYIRASVFHPRRAPIRNPAENPPAPGI